MQELKSGFFHTMPTESLRLLFRASIEGQRNDFGAHRVRSTLHNDFGIDGGIIERHIGERDILLKEGSRGAAGDVADLLSFAIEDAVAVAGNAAFNDLEADKFLFRTTLGLDHGKGFGADEGAFFEFAVAVES